LINTDFIHEPSLPKVAGAFITAGIGFFGMLILRARIRRDAKPDIYRPDILERETYGEDESEAIEVPGAGNLAATIQPQVPFNTTRKILMTLFAVMLLVGSFKGVQWRLILSRWDQGEMYVTLTNYGLAEKEFSKAIKIDKNVRRSQARLADVLERERKYVEAADHLKLAADGNKQDSSVHSHLGDMYQELARFTDAEKEYRQAIAIESGKADYYVRLGSTLTKLHRLDDAEREFRYAISLDDKMVRAHANLGSLLLAKGQPEDGIAHLLRAVELSPTDVDARHTLATGYINVGMLNEAASELRSELAIDPEYAIGYYNLGETLKRMGDFPGALEAFTSYLRKCNTNREAQVGVSMARENIRLLEEKLNIKNSPTVIKENKHESGPDVH
jgi:Flp pilus assembly protein TadD